ncbi:MAG: type I-E CRISPR-associated protein Cas6/Cse3/CasE [Magnetococcales bacterium]|nr:type I-E CRISPR-associated protein Cas6/Cse3/CasE [Magnetococcales bacterium]MBF0150167.1 type I-E CRISPR-associated protein Cas6/Cse3/CasE [Magnetococcales bacterium]MBF0172197.1 type I-E CRISPR-associated protein Cas6/Cse3/CasE [Magnetococcales bacterium]MBF0348831.1 type I-E CRISPR-associated protein Cas6/Cse3/CasE [Magnetococcales bacterium]MBF0630504.1 type I-E CRISPR-associated protein Cas6/Cse3/CasE [Magnetococcales bacterium]
MDNQSSSPFDGSVGRGWFSRIELRHQSGSEKMLARILDDGYQQHQLIWRLFDHPSREKRNFLYRAIEGVELLGYFTVSSTPPLDRDGIWDIVSKEYLPRLSAGEKLRFSIRANPVVTRKQTPHGKGRRHDVVMDAKKHPRDGSDPLDMGKQWLINRAQRHGFNVDHLVVDGYQQHRYHQRSRGPEIRFSTLDFDGWLTVTHPETLTRTLLQGIGPAKGFGCGLLLVRRP